MRRTPPTRKVSLFAGWQQISSSLGHPVEEVLQRAGLPVQLAQQEHVEMTREQFFQFWNALYEGKSLQELAEWFLRLFERVMPAPYLAALCSKSLLLGLERLAEYKALFGPKQMRLEPCRGGLSVVCDWGVEDAPYSLYFAELCILLNFAEKGAGRLVKPLQVEIPGAAHVSDSTARALFGVPIGTGPVMKMTFAEQDLEIPFDTANPMTLKLLEDGLQQRLCTVSERFSERLKFTLKRLLPDQRDRLEDASREMACAPRFLQRQLSNEGTSFREVLFQTRRELSFYYLGKVRFSPKETAFMLGYSETAAFYHAFRRWTGQSPAEFAEVSARDSNR